MNQQITFWGVTASPYQLKMQALADYADIPWQRRPDQVRPWQALLTLLRLKLALKLGRVQKYPELIKNMDEYPAVPFYRLDGSGLYYDSTGLARHLDALEIPRNPLLPQEPATRFLCQLIDDAFDEFGLYMVHHNRWVVSAQTNRMAETTVKELRYTIPPPSRKTVQGKLARRQVRRCPYLFSVAPEGYDCGMPATLTPPSREGFPPTHDLLDTSWRRYLEAMEHLLNRQAFLLGERFTLADASAYGQLGMNLVDGRAADLLQELAPRTHQWLCMIRDGEHRGSHGELAATEHLQPLLSCIADTYLPLMQQNQAAYENAKSQGQQLFNEPAFDRNEALYDGTLMGTPFRSVVKTFQVVTWLELKMQWQVLDESTQQQLNTKFPSIQAFF